MSSFTPLTAVRYSSRSDGVPAVVVCVSPDHPSRQWLRNTCIADIDIRQPAPVPGIRVNPMLGGIFLGSDGSSLVIAGQMFTHDRTQRDATIRWLDNLEFHGGAIVLLIDELPTSDDVDQLVGHGGFLRAIPRD